MHDEHFEIVADFDDRKTLEQALEIANASRIAVSKWLRARDSAPPLRIHLYRTLNAYRAAERELAGGAFAKNLAFSHFETKSAHVALQPPVDDSILAELGPTALTLRLVAHEAAHIVRYRASPTHRSHPRWLADGSATWAEIEALRATGRLDDLGSSPTYGRYMHDVRRAIAELRMPSVDRILRGDSGALTFHETYAVHWVLFDTLARLRPNQLAEQVVPSFEGHDVDAEILETAQAFAPQWNELSRALDTSGRDWIQAAFDTSNATCWRTDDELPEEWTMRGQLTIHDASEHDRLSVLLGNSDADYFAVSFVGGQGVGIMHHEVATDTWQTIAWHTLQLPFAERIPFAIRARTNGDRATLSLEVNGDALGDHTLDRPLDRAWGLSAFRGSVGVWHDLGFD